MAKSSSMFPSGPKKKMVAGPFKPGVSKHKTPKAVQKGITEAYSGQPRKNGAPHTDGD